MYLSADEINRDATELIRRVLRNFDKGKWKWSANECSELLSESYSPLVVAKAKEFELRGRLYTAAVLVILGLERAIINSYAFSRPLEALFILWLGYLIYVYRSSKLSDADNKIVWEELTAKASVESSPRAFLWRLDAFLSRKSVRA